MEKVVPTVLDLLQEGIPALSQGNSALQSTAHVEDIGHDDAAVLEYPVDLPDGLPFTVDGTEKSPSRLLLLRGLKDGFTYQNETKVQNLVMDCLNDALTLLRRLQDATGGAVEAFEYMPPVYLERYAAHSGTRLPFAEMHEVNVLVETATTVAEDAEAGPDGVVPLTARLEAELARAIEGAGE